MCTLIPASAVGVMLLDHDNRLLARASFVRSARPDDVRTIGDRSPATSTAN